MDSEEILEVYDKIIDALVAIGNINPVSIDDLKKIIEMPN